MREWKIPKSSFYYRAKVKDDNLITKQILEVMEENPYYGHRRIAIALGANKKRVSRIMQKYEIKCKMKKKTKKYSTEVSDKNYAPNLIKSQTPLKEDDIWVTDYTCFSIGGKLTYLSTVLDTFTRQVKGWRVDTSRNNNLILSTITEGIKKSTPSILHSDQGVEYTSLMYQHFLDHYGIKLSMSKKGSPWENGYQESFYSRLKEEIEASVTSSLSVEEAREIINEWIDYYNNKRIHSALKMSPFDFSKKQVLLSNFRGT